MKKKPNKTNPKANAKAKPKKKETMKQIYARIKREFSAADLQKYTVDEPMIPARQLLAELESIQAKHVDRQKRSAPAESIANHSSAKRSKGVAVLKKSPSPSRGKAKKETLKQIYARVKREFSAADLQRFTVDEPMVPFDQALAELEAINEKYKKRRRVS